MDDLILLLAKVTLIPGMYVDLQFYITKCMLKHPEFVQPMLEYLEEHPKPKTEDLIEYITIDLLKKQF